MDCHLTILAPDATAVVKDQDGNILATENIPSGVSEDIVVNQAFETFETFEYEASHDGSIVSYADYDAKWVYDNIILPEINLRPNLPKVFPYINALDPRLLKYGVGGNGLNHFGNLQRFTATDGSQDYSNGVFIDHLTGFMHALDGAFLDVWENQIADVWNNFNLLGLNEWYVSNLKNYVLLHAPSNINLIPTTNRILSWLPISITEVLLMMSTTRFSSSSQTLRVDNRSDVYRYDARAKDDVFSQVPKIVTRKAFKYDSLTNKMILDL